MAYVGNKELFAIEWDIDYLPTITHPHMGIHFCFWVHSQRVGDFNDSGYLYTITSYMKTFLTYEKERNIKGSHLFSREDVFNALREVAMNAIPINAQLQEVFYGGLRDTENDYELHSWIQEFFHLDDIGSDCFMDKVSIVLLSDETVGTQRLVWKDWRKMELYEAILPQHCFESVANQFIEEASLLLRRADSILEELKGESGENKG